MINSRSLDDLVDAVAHKAREHIAKCKAVGVELLITSTYRDADSQNALFAQGRTIKGKIVTNARGGQSAHNYRLAYDVVPLRAGKPVWDTFGEDGKLWALVGKLGKESGMEWGGDWGRLKDLPHFQDFNGLTMADLQAGRKPYV